MSDTLTDTERDTLRRVFDGETPTEDDGLILNDLLNRGILEIGPNDDSVLVMTLTDKGREEL